MTLYTLYTYRLYTNGTVYTTSAQPVSQVPAGLGGLADQHLY